MASSKSYFASANSGSGFVGFFDEIFSPCSYRYVIKGGPGTGKSTLMRKLGAKAEEMGYTVEYFLCSSDPESLDGLIIKDLDIAVMDGTAPHTCDPDLPGVNSEIINLGIYWNKKKLKPRADEITELSSKQSELYKKAYGYIAAIEKTRAVSTRYILTAIDREKSLAFAQRLAGKFRPYALGDSVIRLCDSMGMKGYFKTSGFDASQKYVIKPFYRAEYEIMAMIYSALKKRHISMAVSYSHIDAKTVNAILLPEHDVSIVISDSAEAGDTKINTERFTDREKLREIRGKLRFAEKCEKELNDAALSTFDEINTVHFEIENIYKSAMNFTKLSKDTDKIIEKILRE